MNRLHITIFAVILLFSQWGSADHVYHLHDSAEVCDYCLSAHALDHAISSVTQYVFTPSFQQFQPELLWMPVSSNDIHYYSVRAPPRFI